MTTFYFCLHRLLCYHHNDVRFKTCIYPDVSQIFLNCDTFPAPPSGTPRRHSKQNSPAIKTIRSAAAGVRKLLKTIMECSQWLFLQHFLQTIELKNVHVLLRLLRLKLPLSPRRLIIPVHIIPSTTHCTPRIVTLHSLSPRRVGL